MTDSHDTEPGTNGSADPGPSWPEDGFTSGDVDVDVVLEKLDQLTGSPVTEQPELYTLIADGLLAELDRERRE